MKKKIKVQKAFSGKMMKAATAQGKKVIKPGFLGLPPRPPGTVPGSGAGIVKPGQINPFGPGGLPIGGYGNQSGITPVRGQLLPSKPRDPNMFATTPPRPGMQQPDMQYSGNLADIKERLQNINPNLIYDKLRPGVQPLPVASGSGPFGGSVTQPAVVGEPPQSILGDPRLRAATIPGNQAPMQQQPLPTAPNFGGPAPQGGDRFVNMLRQQPAPMQQAPLQQQAAPVQPVPAMKRGGVVRGGRAETKGTRPAKLY